jgi:hypothetical protein
MRLVDKSNMMKRWPMMNHGGWQRQPHPSSASGLRRRNHVACIEAATERAPTNTETAEASSLRAGNAANEQPLPIGA